jgi:hypothetical protein
VREYIDAHIVEVLQARPDRHQRKPRCRGSRGNQPDLGETLPRFAAPLGIKTARR